MSNRTAPTLALRNLPKSVRDGRTVPMRLTVEGGLHYIKGNAKPYFTLTYTQHRKGFPYQCLSGGAGHDYILRFWPKFADIAALHLSDIDGVPMHAEANGWYWLAGTLPGNAGEQYHGGSGRDGKTPEQCLVIFAHHVRVNQERAEAILARAKAELAVSLPDTRAWFRQWIKDQDLRWKAEADACIANHGLLVFGDPWPTPEPGTPEPGQTSA